MDFHAQWLKRRGLTQGCAFWGLCVRKVFILHYLTYTPHQLLLVLVMLQTVAFVYMCRDDSTSIPIPISLSVHSLITMHQEDWWKPGLFQSRRHWWQKFIATASFIVSILFNFILVIRNFLSFIDVFCLLYAFSMYASFLWSQIFTVVQTDFQCKRRSYYTVVVSWHQSHQ